MKKFKFPMIVPDGKTAKEKVEEEVRKTFLVEGGSVVDHSSVDEDTFTDGGNYYFINFVERGKLK